jgi:hypothetical protein
MLHLASHPHHTTLTVRCTTPCRCMTLESPGDLPQWL